LAAGQDWGTGLPAPGAGGSAGADQSAVIGVLKTIDANAAALGDLSMAEAVFQVMRGNFGRGGGLMDAISKGARPPDPDVISTPRGGIDLTHRVAVLWAGAPTASPAWSAIAPHPRAQAEPWLEAWLTTLLPDPSTVVCNVHYTTSAGAQTANVSLRQLGVGALDCLAMANAAEVAQQAELEARILYAAALPAGASAVQISYQPALPPVGFVSFPDFFFLAKSLRSLVSSARPLRPQDLTVPENDVSQAGLVDSAGTATRVAAVLTQLQTDLATLNTAASNPAAVVPLRAALLACSYYGVVGSVPSTMSDANLAAQAASVATVLTSRLAQASAAGSSAPDAIGAMLGADFVLLPRFNPPDPTQLDLAFAQSATLVASDRSAPARWLTQLTHIRPAISRFDEAMTLAQALAGSALAPVAPLLAQLPEVANDTWLGLPINPANPPAKGRVALACFTQGSVAVTPYAGLLIDEWPERIPSTAETAAVAFHYEEPKARAPQACLLAVCPDSRPSWDTDLLGAILEETLELAKIRSVDLASLQQMGPILPALYFALNLKSATVSANFAKESVVVRAPVRR
jgi:hypothetical protein